MKSAFKVAIAVKCHCGHTARAFYGFDGLEAKYEGVPAGDACACNKWEAGKGWKAEAPAFVIRPLPWNEIKRGVGVKFMAATPVGYYEVGADGFMYQPWVCQYPSLEIAKEAAQADFDTALLYLLTGDGSFDQVGAWKRS